MLPGAGEPPHAESKQPWWPRAVAQHGTAQPNTTHTQGGSITHDESFAKNEHRTLSVANCFSTMLAMYPCGCPPWQQRARGQALASRCTEGGRRRVTRTHRVQLQGAVFATRRHQRRRSAWQRHDAPGQFSGRHSARERGLRQLAGCTGVLRHEG
eukprot:1119808-Rhodomonas_salina.1